MRNLFVVSCAFAGTYFLGGNSIRNESAIAPAMVEGSRNEAPFPVESDPRDVSTRRILLDVPNYDIDEIGGFSITPIIGDDGNVYDDDLLDLEDILGSLESIENHTDDEQFVENLIIDQDITEVDEEELVDPEAYLDEIEEVATIDYDRKLSNPDFHTPLACNEGIEDKDCATSFRSLVESISENQLLVVPCGECVVVDYDDGSEITLPNGLSIEGKLHFPSTASMTLRTKFVWVAGILEIETPDEGKQIKFSMYGEELQTYTAINPDSTLCSGGCNMGSKVIAVVGGRLDIKGDADNCPAWEKLANVGTPSPRPFKDHLPCNGDTCWEDDTIKFRGPCRESKGHSDALGKYTVYCPIEHKNEIRFGDNKGIKLTSIADNHQEFTYPEADGQQLSLKLAGKCVKAGHTNHFNKCVVHCPLHSTAVVRHGFNQPLMFTSKINENELPVMPPSGVSLRLRQKCWNSGGHTNAYKRCSVMCRVFPTAQYNGGENSGKLNLKSKFVEEAVPFPVPTSKAANGEEGKFVLKSQCVYLEGHSNAWGGCVVLCPLESTHKDLGSMHAASRMNNPRTGEYVNTARTLQYAHNGGYMFLLMQDITKEQCSTMGAQSLNDVFQVGDEIVPSYQISTDPSENGNTFSVDQILHYSYAGNTLLFLPSEGDIETCDETAADFSTKFPPGYEIEVEHDNYPTGGDTFQVNSVHHWSWAGRHLFFFPEESDVETCDATVSDFNSKFAKNFEIDVSITKNPTPLGQEVVASSGVHHWSWAKSGLFFFPDETDTQINEKFPVGFTMKVDFLNETDVWDIQVSSEAAECWKPGSEILLTSHTHSEKDRQVRTIESSNTETGLLRLSAPINKPISLADDEDFAIEVAQLNRRIVFEADGDSNDENIGGHLIVHHTESPQHIEGVEVRNFGQLGRLGRYPIHFHKCGDSPDSMVRRNVVRESNQRCYVTHLSNQITIEENVASDAIGHCYFIEDGAETGNIFRKNLGSGVKRMPTEAASKLGEKSNRKETDSRPAVFWISNPQNKFYGNVAAGSQGHGYWYETHGARRHMGFGSIGAFVDNEVHSTDHIAFTVYSPGWMPNEEVDLVNLKVYRNRFWGSFLHATRNLNFDGGVFADNGDKAVMISRGDDIVFDGTSFVGQTELVNKNCRKEKVALHLDPVRLRETVIWNFNGRQKGTTVKNSKFLNWSQKDTNCQLEATTPLKFFSHQTFTKVYSAPHVFENLEFDDPAYSLDATLAGSGIDDVQIEVSSDQNGAFTPDGSSGFLLTKKFQHLVPTTCFEYNENLVFCPDACLRTVAVLAGNSAFFDDDIVMVVTDGNGHQTEITRNVRGHPQPNPVGNQFFASYPLPLPAGKFEISFRDISGAPAWPKSAFPALEAAPVSCSNYVTASDITFVKPDSERSVCNELVHNGNFDLGKDGWYAFHHGIDVLETGGVDGSPGLASRQDLNRGNNLAQYLDVSCLTAGDEFDFSLSYKMVDYDGSGNLPYVKLQVQDYDMSDPSNKHLAHKGGMVFRTNEETFDSSGWNTISAVWKINESEAASDKIVMFLGGGSHKIVIDNVSITRKEQIITDAPSLRPSGSPSASPTAAPTPTPSRAPSSAPSASPTSAPSGGPTSVPSATPTPAPTLSPTATASETPTATPTSSPSSTPSVAPSSAPTDSSSMKELRQQIKLLQQENDRLRELETRSGGCGSTSHEEETTLTSDMIVRRHLRQ